jgi:hypothetical protein
MKIRQFLEHHGIAENPFADEDAQTDLIFKGYCITNAYHPTWDKIYGNPAEPATAVVFGEKGSGKTALRLQITKHLADHNADHPGARVFVVQYDDFNPFLDRCRERFSGRRRRPERVLGQWKLWDHADAILSLAATQLVDRILEVRQASHPAAVDTQPLPIASLDRAQRRDVLLLAACYDQSSSENVAERWKRLRKKLRYPVWRSKWDLVLGILVTLAVAAVLVGLRRWGWWSNRWLYVAIAVIAAGWLPWLYRLGKWTARAWKIARSTRVLNRNVAPLRRVLLQFPPGKLVGQPLPAHARTDDRYELLAKLQNVLRTLGFPGIIVLVDRVDEPYLINGSAELMRALVWPMLDNKLLKHPGMGFKLLLPEELIHFVDREDRDFHQRARLDKQNLIRSLEWTGQSLFDLAESRLTAAAVSGRSPTMAEFFDDDVEPRRLVELMGSLRTPRHLFKFLYRLFVSHTNAHTDDQPVSTISRETLEKALALYQRDQAACDRSAGAG